MNLNYSLLYFGQETPKKSDNGKRKEGRKREGERERLAVRHSDEWATGGVIERDKTFLVRCVRVGFSALGLALVNSFPGAVVLSRGTIVKSRVLVGEEVSLE